MNRHGAAVQLRSGRESERVWTLVTGPLDLGEDEIVMTSLALRAQDVIFLERYASYRNALAYASDKKLRQQWSKKSLAESFLTAQIDGAREQLAEMFAAVGDFPKPTGKKDPDDEAMRAYAARVIAWDKKRNSGK